MRETSFIKQNQEKWKEFEKILEKNAKDPDKLNDLFVQITDDLSYSRTFYPNRSVRVYLNNLAQQVFHSIYKNKKTKSGRLIYFWTDELPQLVYNARKEFRLALIIFLSAMFIGAFSSYMDPEFPRAILGDTYVDMTLENIETGDPMAVYKQKGQFGMSLGITANNLFVAFLTFILGVFFAIGSIAIMISNGVMVGAFQFFFYEQGVFKESFLTIWTHGTLEISAIIIAGAAGITMGKGLIFPGTLTRLQAFQKSARRGLKIMIGIVPIFILAGFIEGFLTRHTETPDGIRLVFILLCLAFILGYFVWYPIQKARVGFKNPIKEIKLPPNDQFQLDFSRIKSSGEIFTETFVFLKLHFRTILLTILGVSVLYCFPVFFFASERPSELFAFPLETFGALQKIGQYYMQESLSALPLLNIFVYTILSFITFTLLINENSSKKSTEPSEDRRIYYLGNFFKILVPIAILSLLLMTNTWYTIFLFLAAAPILFLWMYIMYQEQMGLGNGLSRTFFLVSGNYGQVIGLFSITIAIGVLFYSVMDTFLLGFYFEMLSWNFSLEQEILNDFIYILLTFTSLIIICFIFTLFIVGSGLLYHSLLETKEAISLKERIQQIGIRKRIRGLEIEG